MKNKREEKQVVNHQLIRQTLEGYARADKSIQRERRQWLARLTVADARRIFDELNQNMNDWKKFGGDLKSLEARRIASKIRGRRIFTRMAQRRNK
ncbi:MAG: hypothetical protein HZC40_15885 [Chloroflexi bacterium]|nr:hypothetical protein [Chloroflexota bacterium]